MKNPDMPKDQPVLAKSSKRPSLKELAELGTDKLSSDLKRILPGAASGQVDVAAFNSSI
jgi:FXSXX-COOH protein